jgi:methyl-accepting chemotaxis protein
MIKLLLGLRLSTRLQLAFGLVVLVSTLANGFALMQMQQLRSNLDLIVNDNNVKVTLSEKMAESVHIASRVVRTIALMSDEKLRAEEGRQITAARQAYADARRQLEAFGADAPGREHRAAIDAAAATALPLNDKVIELTRLNQDADALALLLKTAAPATQAWQAAIDANVHFQQEATAAEFQAATRRYEQARALMIGATITSLLLGVAMSLLMVRSVVAELGGEPRDVAALVRRIADADLRSPIALRPGDEGSVLAAMARMQQSLSSIVSAVRGNSDGVATASAQIAQGNADLSQRTEQQASALQQTAATMDELGATVRNNADNAQQANQLAAGASSVAARGGEVVGQVVGTMRGINDSSKKIAEIIGVIDGIAFQTNILALNAAVEAARAGEQGRGFAVVAGEVRALAQRSAAAAREIKALITSSVEQVEHGSALVDQAGHTMEEIVGAIRRVSDIVAEISTASHEQSSGVGQVGQAVAQMDQSTQQNAALVEQSAAAAESLKQQAQELVDTVAVFKLRADA